MQAGGHPDSGFPHLGFLHIPGRLPGRERGLLMPRFTQAQMNAIMEAFPGMASSGMAITEEVLFGDEHPVDRSDEGAGDDGSDDEGPFDDTAAMEAFPDDAAVDDAAAMEDFLADEVSPDDISADDTAADEAAWPEAPPRRSRAEQSRINGARSRGPTSAAGKAASAQNAYKHGLRSRGHLAPGEDPAEFEAYVAAFRDDLRPDGPCQAMLAERAAEMAWKLGRIPLIRSAVLYNRRDPYVGEAGPGGLDEFGDLICELKSDDNKGGAVMLMQRYETQIERSMHRALRELRILQGGSRQGRSPQGENHAMQGAMAATPPTPPTASPPQSEPTSRVRSANEVAAPAAPSVTRASSPCEVRDASGSCSERQLDADIARTGWKPVSRTEPSATEANRGDSRVRSAVLSVVATQDLCTPDAKLGFVRQSA